jgi:type VI secretion system protein ImpH
VRQFVRRWAHIDEEQRGYLGRPGVVLGENAVIGRRVEDRASKFRLVLGPLGFLDFKRYLPDGPRYAELCGLVRFLVADQVEFDIELQLTRTEVPPLELGRRGACQLGWSTWLARRPEGCDGIVLLRPASGGLA